MKRAFVALAVVAILVASCSGGSKPKPGPSSPVTLEATQAAPSPSPPASTTTPTPVPAIGIDWSHRLAVYTAQVGVEQQISRVLPRRAVVTWDLDAGKLAASFEYTAGREYPVGVALVGRDVVFATDARVVRANLDGTDQQVLLKAGESNLIQDIRVSPDGRMLAVVVSPNDIFQPGTLHVLDLQSGAERFRVDQADARFAGMRGHFWQVQWRDDGNGVLVGTATHSEMYGSLATIFLDGRVRVEDVQGYGNVSPTGRMRAGDVGEIGCMFIGSHEFVILNLDTGTTPVRAGRSESTVYTPWEWSPDGSQFVFMQQEARTCDELSADKQVAYVVTTDGHSFGAPARVNDLAALHREWYGDRLFSADCVTGNEPVVDFLGKQRLGCMGSGGGPDAVRTVAVGGRPVGAAVAPEPVGVIDPGATLAFARVKAGGDCLNVRENPATSAPSIGCFHDGVLLRLRTDTEQTADGITWVAVETPAGRDGWSAAQFLETVALTPLAGTLKPGQFFGFAALPAVDESAWVTHAGPGGTLSVRTPADWVVSASKIEDSSSVIGDQFDIRKPVEPTAVEGQTSSGFVEILVSTQPFQVPGDLPDPANTTRQLLLANERPGRSAKSPASITLIQTDGDTRFLNYRGTILFTTPGTTFSGVYGNTFATVHFDADPVDVAIVRRIVESLEVMR